MQLLKRIGLSLLNKIDKLLMVLTGTIAGLSVAQFPQYLAQYLQRLGGHIDEAAMAARIFHLPQLGERAIFLAKSLREIADASQFLKLPVFFLNAQWEIARETLRNFTPGMTFNQEGMAYLLTGCLLGIIVYGLIKSIISLFFKIIGRIFKKKPLDQAGRGITPI